MFLKSKFFKGIEKKQILLFQKDGFSLVETAISIAALGFFALLVQSMLLLGHSFVESQKNFFESAQITSVVKQQLCFKNSSFKITDLEFEKSYSIIEENRELTPEEEEAGILPIVDRKYKKLENIISGTDLFTDQTGLVKLQLSAPLEIDGVTHTDYYEVLQDSHTIVTLKMDMANLLEGGFREAYIFASRCVENKASTRYTKDDGEVTTFNPDQLEQSSISILAKDIRPYYFPKPLRAGSLETSLIKCCEDGTKEETCSSTHIPRIYIIYLKPPSSGLLPPTTSSTSEITSDIPPLLVEEGTFIANIEHVQEFPEMQDIQNIWGAGFVTSMNSNIVSSQTGFRIEIMMIKNTCVSSSVHFQKCPLLSLGENPNNLYLKNSAEETLKMSHFMKVDVSSCSGFSSGVDTSALIQL